MSIQSQGFIRQLQVVLSAIAALFIAWFSVDANASTSSYTYDFLNRLTQVDYGNGMIVNYTYDAAGNRLTYSSAISLSPPVISTQPLDKLVSVGGNSTFSVVASGQGTLSYLWKLNGNPVTSSPNASLALTGINAAQAGNYTVDVSNSAGSVTSQPALLTVLQSSFAGWQPAWFTSAELSNSTISGMSSDPNSDGVSNWMSFALGMNPKGSNAPGSLPVVSLVPQTGSQYLSLSYHRLIGLTNIPYKVCVSDDLKTWDVTESQIESVGSPVPTGDGLTETVSVRLKTPISNGIYPRKFLRLKVTSSVIKLSSSGYNGSGQLGDGTSISRETPVFVDQTTIGQRTVSAISEGDQFSLALTTDGKVFSWGGNTFGQLGDGTTTQRTTPVMCGTISGKTVAAIAAGGNHCLALTTDGLVYSWGYNGYGQLGDGTTTQRNSPVAVNTSGALSGKTVVSIAAGSEYSLALTSDGKVFSWGNGDNGTIGNGSIANQTLPVAVDVSGLLSGKFISVISAGAYHCLALSSDGKVFSWGGAGVGQLGSGDSTNQSRPVAVNLTSIEAGSVVNAIAAGGYSSIALTSTGNLLSWGYNIDGQVGDGTQTTRFLPVPLTLGGTLQGRKISAIFAGLNHCVALTPEGSVVAWGKNVHGEYGDGTTVSSTVPVAAGFSATRIAVGSTSQHTLSTSEH